MRDHEAQGMVDLMRYPFVDVDAEGNPSVDEAGAMSRLVESARLRRREITLTLTHPTRIPES